MREKKENPGQSKSKQVRKKLARKSRTNSTKIRC